MPTLVPLLLVLALPVAADSQKPTPAPASPCCFANPAYSGVCQVTPVAGETCGSILTYLNNPQAAGKGYCNSSDLRGSWTARACAPPKAEKDNAPRATR